MSYLSKPMPTMSPPLSRTALPAPTVEPSLVPKTAMQMAAQCLVEQGHKDIIVLLGDSTVISSFRERLNALSFCPDKARYHTKELDDVTALGLRRGAFEYMDVLLSAGKPTSTAILACNSAIALGALMALNKHKVTVGQDMALFSLDDADWISAVPNPISPCSTHCRRSASRRCGAWCTASSTPTRAILRCAYSCRA